MYSSLPWIAIALFVCSLALWQRLPASRSRFRATFGMLGLWLLFWVAGQAGSYWHIDIHLAQELARTFIALAGVQFLLGVLFDLAVARLGLARFITEAAVIAGYVGVILNLFFRLGVNVSSIFETSAVVAAVIGLSLQDTLGNMASFIALQLEDEIQHGDFIQCSEGAGWVQAIRLRHTALTTVDGDRVLLPNGVLTRLPVTILSRSRRIYVPFTMSYAHNPQELIDAVTAALSSSPIPEIASDPAPSCIIAEMTPGHIKYAAVVRILNPGHETFAISAVLKRIYFALERAGIPTEEISYLVEMKKAKDDSAHKTTPEDILQQTPIFRLLDKPELAELGSQLRHLAYATGERILRQGDDGESMYFVSAGQVAINYVGSNGTERQVALLGPGEFFGEMSLLTGAPNNANAIAASRVYCYRLDKSGLQGIVERRPELLEDMSALMTRRHDELAVVREAHDRETSRVKEDNQSQLLARIRRFFGIDGNSTTTLGL